MTKSFAETSVLDIKRGQDPYLDALLLHFMTENSLEYTIDATKNASPEQIRFMLALPDDRFYAPCSDWMLKQLLHSDMTDELQFEYKVRWRRFVKLVYRNVPDRELRRKILTFCRYKFRMAYKACIVIPSRLMKRMVTIFMTQSGLDDPFRKRKAELNKAAASIKAGPDWDRVVTVCPEKPFSCARIEDLRFELDCLEARRLLVFSTMPEAWGEGDFPEACKRVEKDVDEHEKSFEPFFKALNGGESQGKRILYLPDTSGALMHDLEVIRSLLRQGHKVILVLKEGFYFDAPTFWDRDTDPVLAEELEDARFITNLRITKNELLREMRANDFLVISDGSRERFNPYRMGVTFARSWKECDLVLAKGEKNFRRLVNSSHSFTRDIFSVFRDHSNKFHMLHKPKASWVLKFGEGYILSKAEEIIREMRRAKNAGNAVMFYSGIVGSIPGQVDMAIKVMNTFIQYMRSQLDGVHIINPGEHFEEGMDADDLMFMWETVQRSGFITVWRFQSVTDIEKSFSLMGRKVPPVWAGKDSTYSTGCTKEMHIALDVQKKHPELQIIGPNHEKFFRRREYGVGRFCDTAIDEC